MTPGEQWSQEAADSSRRFSVDASGGSGLPLHLQGSLLLQGSALYNIVAWSCYYGLCPEHGGVIPGTYSCWLCEISPCILISIESSLRLKMNTFCQNKLRCSTLANLTTQKRVHGAGMDPRILAALSSQRQNTAQIAFAQAQAQNEAAEQVTAAALLACIAPHRLRRLHRCSGLGP